MHKQIALVLCLVMLSPSLLSLNLSARAVYPIKRNAVTGLPVHNTNTGLDYASIQEAIDAEETLDGHTIQVDPGTYYEHVTVDKRLSLVGGSKSDTTVDGGGAEVVVDASWHVNISGFTVRNGKTGIATYGFCRIVGNDIRQVTVTGIRLGYDENSALGNCVERGISLGLGSYGNTIKGNNVSGSISLFYAGDQNTVSENRIVGGDIGLVNSNGNEVVRNSIDRNFDYNGIYLFDSSDDVIVGNEIFNCDDNGVCVDSFCNNLTFLENTVRDCSRSIYLTGSVSELRNHKIYHNNFINNKFGVLLNGPSTVQWDDGYPSGGNFWSDYDGEDMKKGPYQNETGRDNIGDTPYINPEGYHGGFQDQYPLVNPFPYSEFLNITAIIFDADDTTHFNITIHNSPLSLTPANLVRIEVIMENRTAQEIDQHNTLPSLPFQLLPNASIVVRCSWNWSRYQYRDVFIAISAEDGYTAYAKQKTPLIKPGFIRVPQDYKSIHEAITAANPGDVVFVSSGIYYEHIIIDKRLTLVGQDRTNTTIDGKGEDATIIQVTASIVNITGFTIQNTHARCIRVYSTFDTVDSVIISQNIIASNDDWGDGIDFSGDNALISENEISNCFYGLQVNGNNNTIIGNNITSCSSWELTLSGCSYSSLSENNCGSAILMSSTGNTLRRNSFSKIYFYGIDTLSDASNDIDPSNLLNGNRIYYLVNQRNLLIDPVQYPLAGFLGLVNCSNIIINGLTLDGGGSYSVGELVLMAFTNDSTLMNVRLQNAYEAARFFNCHGNSIIHDDFTDCWFGVRAEYSNDNVIRGNTLDCLYGLGMAHSRNNTVFHNNFMDHWGDVYLEDTQGSWDDGKEGNYWSSYNGTDADRDGIGDTPYTIDSNNKDQRPLMQPWSPPAHDVAVCGVVAAKTVLGEGLSGNVTIYVSNNGKNTETFNVTAYANGTVMGTQQVTNLNATDLAALTFTWNTTGLAYGNYTISACAEPVLGESDATDNNCTGRWVTVSIIGDIMGLSGWPDGRVDMRDIGYVAKRFGTTPGNTLWDPNADVNGDFRLDMKDIGIVAKHFGEHYP